jgi:uncharacterized membrane protein (DUF106 family)
MMKLFIIIGAIAAIIAGMILTLIRGILVDRTRARNKQMIMDHYGDLTGWPTENAGSKDVDESCGH